ncbi:hypothetical protein BS47DRAFT_1369444 [Hydnum rufescens UP504]|uniref:DUF6532 domain-containing protein n=1 Tax=Hydnum rufescens UP504 TaxID=1448309 RepID=A0A9P6AD93_9AGAM|nr:hypothetical protein BS47DRAFT_1369444 [Hydnum rufescens UP504]
MEDELCKQWHVVVQPMVLKGDSAHGSSEIRNFFDDEISDMELATLSAPGTPVANGMPLKRVFAVVDLGEKDQSLVLQSTEKRLQTLGHVEGTPVPAKVVSLLCPGIHTNKLLASPHLTENTMPTILGNLIIHEASGFQLWLKQRVQIIVPLLYNFPGKDQNTAKGIVEAALEFQCYRYEFFMGHPNMPHQNGLCHPTITLIIRTFFETNDVKVFAFNIMPSFIEMPIETVAFALTILWNFVLCTERKKGPSWAWADGIHTKKAQVAQNSVASSWQKPSGQVRWSWLKLWVNWVSVQFNSALGQLSTYISGRLQASVAATLAQGPQLGLISCRRQGQGTEQEGEEWSREGITMLNKAVKATKIHETLSSWKTGVLEQKGQKLSAAVYSQIYQGHVGWIQQWKDKPICSEEWKKISKDLGEEAACMFHHYCDWCTY